MGPQSRLNEYLREQRGKCFDLGKHDCFTFTNGAWAAMHGGGYADDVIGKYKSMGPKSLQKFMLKSFGHDNLTDCFDAHMTRVEGIPPRGAIVMSSRTSRWFTGKALGISMGTKAVFLGDLDMLYMHITEIEAAWVK
jgi:hypothetical protein